jgi:hypothetical protein
MRSIKGSLVGLVLAGILALVPTAAFAMVEEVAISVVAAAISPGVCRP